MAALHADYSPGGWVPFARRSPTDADSLCDDHRLYHLNDANFNITTLVDPNGDALERYVYTPYGKPTIYDATWSNTRGTSSYENVVTYTGREHDLESGIMHYRNRYYSTELGRFLSRDPAGYADVYSLYEYVGGSPLIRTDPLGELVVESNDVEMKGLEVAGQGDWKGPLLPHTRGCR